MSVIESECRVSVQRRLIPLQARFSPEFFAQISVGLRELAGTKERGMLGLLFGRTERNIVSLQAFFAVTADSTPRARSCEREQLDRALDEMLAKSKLRPEFAGLELVGWCSLQSTDELTAAPRACLEFHTHRFRRASDVLLILRSGTGRDLLGQLYARLSDAPVSLEHYASGRVSIDLERPLKQPVSVNISEVTEAADFELYFRTYESARAREKAEKRQARREAFKRVIDWRRPLLPMSTAAATQEPAKTPNVPTLNLEPPNVDAITSVISAPPQVAIVRAALVPQMLPRVEIDVPVPNLHRSGSRVWIISAAMLLLMASGLTVAFFKLRPANSREMATAALTPQNGGLGLQIHFQGNNLMLVWDREAPAMRTAVRGQLRIQDGAEHRTAELQPAELANGSILYRPSSDDVDFLLMVYNADGSVTREGVRAVDGTIGSRTPAAEPQLAPAALRARFRQTRSTPLTLERRASPAAAVPIGGAPGATAPGYIAPQPLRVVMPDIEHLDGESLPIGGKIVVEVDVDEQGRVTGARIPLGAPRVGRQAARAAIAAAEQWRFEPAKMGAKTVPSRHRLIFDIGPGTR